MKTLLLFFRSLFLALFLMAFVSVWGQNDEDVANRLHIQGEQQNGMQVQLYWSDLGPSAHYVLQRQLPGETTFSTLTSTESVTFTDNLPRVICSDSVRYKVQTTLRDTLFISNTLACLVHDNEPTAPCSLDVVSVNSATQHIVLSWEPSLDPDIMGYLICKGSPCLDFDTLWGASNCSYECSNLSAEEIHSFRIYAFDSCLTASALTEAYHNIVMQAHSVPCTRTVSLSWNDYVSMPNGLKHYRLMADEGGGFHQVAQILPSQTLEYNYEVPSSADNIIVAIEAVDSTETHIARSNEVYVEVSSADTAEYIELRKVSVTDDGASLWIYGEIDPTFSAPSCTLYRSVNAAPFQPVATIPNPSGTFSWHDVGVQPNENRYTYRLGVMDACGEREKYSSTLESIQLERDKSSGQLYWNPYGATPPVSYTILRRSGLAGEWQSVGTTSETTFSDPVDDFSETLWYRIVATSLADTSSSSLVSYYSEGAVWLPNVFTPTENSNQTFCVYTTGIDVSQYSLRIFSREGTLLFETDDPTHCWDGTYRGHPMPQDNYVCLVFCAFGNGETRYYKANLLLLR